MSNTYIIPQDGLYKPEPPPASQNILPSPTGISPSAYPSTILDKNDASFIQYIGQCLGETSISLNHLVEDLPNLARVLQELGVTDKCSLNLDQILDSRFLPENNSSQGQNPTFLSNGHKQPSQQRFHSMIQELQPDIKNVYHSIRRDLPKPGYSYVPVNHFQDFWKTLHEVGTYWDTSLDTRDTTGPSAFINLAQPYKGRRLSSGEHMPWELSAALVEDFLEPIMKEFGCHFSDHPMPDAATHYDHKLYLASNLVPTDRTRQIYSEAADEETFDLGILLGPVAVLNVHKQYDEHGYYNVPDGEYLLQDLKALLTCAQQRARDGKQPYVPGVGKEWSKTGRELSKATGRPINDLDADAGGRTQLNGDKEELQKLVEREITTSRVTASSDTAETAPTVTVTEVEDHEATYLAPGRSSSGPLIVEHPATRTSTQGLSTAEKSKFYNLKLKELRLQEGEPEEDRESIEQKQAEWSFPASPIFPLSDYNMRSKIGSRSNDQHDEIYLISITNHHISFVSTRLHNSFVDWLSPDPEEHARAANLTKDTKTWWGIPLKRTRWYNLFDAADRCEALKGAWTIFNKMLHDVQEGDRLAPDNEGM